MNGSPRSSGRVSQLRLLMASLALLLVTISDAQAQPAADLRLAELIRLSLFASPYASAQIPEQWCYYTEVDQAYSWWYLMDSASGTVGGVQVQNAFGIPLALAIYGAQANGAIIIGYVIDGGRPAGNLAMASPPGPNEPACAIGARILTGGPYPIVGLAADLAHQSSVDPAPEYRLWTVKGSYHQVRLIQAIPISFQVGNSQAAGRLLLGFTGNW